MAKGTARAASDLKDRVRELFRSAYPEAYVDVSDGYRGNLHVVIVSRAFDNLTERQKQDAVWTLARQGLGAGARRISMLLAYSPDELKG